MSVVVLSKVASDWTDGLAGLIGRAVENDDAALIDRALIVELCLDATRGLLLDDARRNGGLTAERVLELLVGLAERVVPDAGTTWTYEGAVRREEMRTRGSGLS